MTHQICYHVYIRLHKAEVIYLQTKLMVGDLFITKIDFETCKYLKLQNCGNNGSKVERNKEKFEQVLLNFG